MNIFTAGALRVENYFRGVRTIPSGTDTAIRTLPEIPLTGDNARGILLAYRTAYTQVTTSKPFRKSPYHTAKQERELALKIDHLLTSSPDTKNAIEAPIVAALEAESERVLGFLGGMLDRFAPPVVGFIPSPLGIKVNTAYALEDLTTIEGSRLLINTLLDHFHIDVERL
jgi:hypothetical protein